ncbi:MAG: hypothetical protein V1870_05425, partial [Candidatus Aenigmatarchaeota archaeon]
MNNKNAVHVQKEYDKTKQKEESGGTSNWGNVVSAVRKAVIPAAGSGTRFLPWTGINAKELIPVIDPRTGKIRAVIELV